MQNVPVCRHFPTECDGVRLCKAHAFRRGGILRETMPYLRLFRVLLSAALLSVGHAAAAHSATGGATERAELAPSSSHITGAALPAHVVVSAAMLAKLDLRGVRPASSVHSGRDRSRRLPARRRPSSAASCEPGADYAPARLLRGGIDSSSLGTPPPQS